MNSGYPISEVKTEILWSLWVYNINLQTWYLDLINSKNLLLSSDCVFLVWIVLLGFLKSQFILTHLFDHLITGNVDSWVNLWGLSFFSVYFNITYPFLILYNSVAISICSFSKICLDASAFLFPLHLLVQTTIIISLDYYKASWMISFLPAFVSLEAILYSSYTDLLIM